MAGTVDARLREKGIEIPEAAAPVANYVGHVVTGNLCFVSGQVTLDKGEFKHRGKLGAEISLDEGYRAACGGDLDKVRRVVKLTGFVNSTPDFTDQPKVVNGASDLMIEVFGDAGRHSRAAVSAGALPVGVAVEVEAVAELDL